MCARAPISVLLHGQAYCTPQQQQETTHCQTRCEAPHACHSLSSSNACGTPGAMPDSAHLMPEVDAFARHNHVLLARGLGDVEDAGRLLLGSQGVRRACAGHALLLLHQLRLHVLPGALSVLPASMDTPLCIAQHEEGLNPAAQRLGRVQLRLQPGHLTCELPEGACSSRNGAARVGQPMTLSPQPRCRVEPPLRDRMRDGLSCRATR